jgi:hypothetical protein
MMQLRRRIVTALLTTLLAVTGLTAQTVDELAALYPEEHAVITSYQKDTRIFLKNGQPQIENRISIEMLMLSDRANGLYNRYHVYHGSFRELKDLEAYTRVPDGNGYKKIKVTDIRQQNATSSSIFYDNTRESLFDFPALTKGAIAVVKYTELITDAHLIDPYYFTSYIPIVQQTCSVSYPAEVGLEYILRNQASQNITVTGSNRSVTFTASHLKPQTRYNNSPKRAYFEPHVLFRIRDLQQNGSKTGYLGNLDDLYQWNYHFIRNVNTADAPLIRHLADSLTQQAKTDREKAMQIYSWVQANIKYVAFEEGLDGFIPREAQLVCGRRFGDCKDMSSVLTALLRAAGLKAYFTWIGTRDIPYDYTEVALPVTDNHMITTLELDGNYIFLDGTSSNCIFGFPSGFIQGKQALVGINEKEYKVLRVPEMESSRSELVDSTFIAFSDHGIKGNSRVHYGGYWGVEVRDNLLYKETSDIRDYVNTRMGRASNKFSLGQYRILQGTGKEEPVSILADFEIPGYGSRVADELYINLNLEKMFTPGAIIDTTKRKTPIEAEFKYLVRQYTILDIPQHYEVEYVPQDFRYSDDKLGFEIHYTREKGRVIALQQMRYDHLLMQPADFGKWNNMVSQVLTRYKEQVVFKKINNN